MGLLSSPVLTLDGPSGSGKGTISGRLARRLNWHVLYSGLLYRGLAIAAEEKGFKVQDEEKIVDLALNLDIDFITEQDDSIKVFLFKKEITSIIFLEKTGTLASLISGYASVRLALLEKQRRFQQCPGLIAEGRDMGTVVFSEAPYKVFLTASAEARAERRYQQLIDQGEHATLSSILVEIKARDARDEDRAIAPLTPAASAWCVDSTHLTVEEVVNHILDHFGL